MVLNNTPHRLNSAAFTVERSGNYRIAGGNVTIEFAPGAVWAVFSGRRTGLSGAESFLEPGALALRQAAPEGLLAAGMNTPAANTSFCEIAAAMRCAQRIAVLAHRRPDGDAIGSQLAVLLALRSMDKDVVAWNEDPVPRKFHFLSGVNGIAVPPATGMDFDLAVVLDNSDRSRVGAPLNSVARCPLWINIDHHVTNDRYGDLVYVDPAASATGEILHDFFEVADIALSPAIAAALYVAVSTDTGSFQYPSTSPHTMEVGASLLRAGADVERICTEVYGSYPAARVRLLAALLPTLEFAANGCIASLALTRAMFAQTDATREDTEGLIDQIRSIDTVALAMLFEEADDGSTRVSMRSKSFGVDVSALCATFGGGGHPRAAGATIDLPVKEARVLVGKQAESLMRAGHLTHGQRS